MRHTKCLLVVLVLFFVSMLNARSDAGLLKHGRLFYVRGSIGYGTQELGDLNNRIERVERMSLPESFWGNWDTFNGAADFGGEFGFRITPAVSTGVGVSYQNNSASNSYTDIYSTFLLDTEVSVFDLTGNVALWLPALPGLCFGVSAGVGFGTFEDVVSFQMCDDPSQSYRIQTDGDGKGFVGGLFAGYEAAFTSGPTIFTKIGYRHRNLGKFEGTRIRQQFGSGSGVFRFSGGTIDFDYSGVFIVVGFGVTLGKVVQ